MSATISIIQIGYNRFAVRKPADAAAMVRLMAEAMPVDYTVHNSKVLYFPSTRDRDSTIGMEVIPAAHLVAADPKIEPHVQEDLSAPRRRGLRLTGPSIKPPPSTE